MKKILTVLFLMVTALTFSNVKTTESSQDKILLQNELLNKLDFKSAKGFEKYKEVIARKAIIGEEILTYTKDGLETKNIAKAGDYVVKNNTEAKEMYILTEKKFNARYELKGKIDNNWNIYKPLGKVKGIKVTNKIFKKLGIEKGKKEFYIMANWGEKMVVKKNDYLVAPFDNSEVYRIAKKEFFETYKEIK